MNEIFKKNCFWFLSFTCDVKFFLKLGTSQTEVTNLKINFFVSFLYFLYGGWQFLYLFFKFFLIFAFSFFHCTIHSVKSCDRNYPKKKSLSFLNLPQKWRRTDDKLKIRDGVKSPDVLTRVLCRHFHKLMKISRHLPYRPVGSANENQTLISKKSVLRLWVFQCKRVWRSRFQYLNNDVIHYEIHIN